MSYTTPSPAPSGEPATTHSALVKRWYLQHPIWALLAVEVVTFGWFFATAAATGSNPPKGLLILSRLPMTYATISLWLLTFALWLHRHVFWRLRRWVR